ncbi:MAG: Fe-S cluster assembly protein SufD [Alphaproteobacteria bacterium]
MTVDLKQFRSEGQAAFEQTGLPTRKLEQWKYTPLNKLEDLGFGGFAAADMPSLDALPASVPDIDAYRIVLVNGRYSDALSDMSGLDDRATLIGLDAAVTDSLDVVHGILGHQVKTDMPMAALNAARFEDGIVLHVPKSVALEKPVHLVSLSVGSDNAVAAHPRLLISLGENAEATLVESHLSIGDGVTLVNGVSEISVGPHARLGHYKLQTEAANATHVWLNGVTLHDSAAYDSFVLQLGDGLVRNEVRALLDGEHIDARLNGAYFGTGSAHIDNTTFIDHAKPNCQSREVFKGVLDDQSRGVFQGKILVRPHAQKTDGHQLNRALLLSPKAEIDSKPELEIYADDVKCSHGATTGDLDPDQLFYLKARGIDEAQARAMLVQAFLMESIDVIEKQAVRDVFADTLQARLTKMFGDMS